jgi:hypothetical protein
VGLHDDGRGVSDDAPAPGCSSRPISGAPEWTTTTIMQAACTVLEHGFGAVARTKRLHDLLWSAPDRGGGVFGVSLPLEQVFGITVVHSVGAESRRPQVRSRPSAMSVGASSVVGDDQSPSGRTAGDDSSDHTVRTAFRERPFQR